MRYREIINSRCRDEWILLFYQWVHNEVDRKMLERRFLDGVYLEPLAEEFEISVNYCQARTDAAIKQVFKHIKTV